MALDGTYSGLQASIADWLARSTLTAVIPDLIALCEADFLSGGRSDGEAKPLRVRQMEAASPITLNAQKVALPAGYLEMRNLRITAPSSEGCDLTFVTPQYIYDRYQLSTDTGTPRFYAIEGANLVLGPTPDVSYTGEIDMYSFTALSALAPSNWALTSYPALYLYGSLLQAMPYLKNDARIPTWQGKYEAAIDGVLYADMRARYPMGQLVSRVAGRTP